MATKGQTTLLLVALLLLIAALELKLYVCKRKLSFVGFRMSLSPSELERYNRQMLISGWGLEGQRKLKASKVIVAGLGGLGCPASLYLAAAGIGKIVLVDKGKFKLSDLNRQILCWQRDVGRFKAEVAKEKLER